MGGDLASDCQSNGQQTPARKPPMRERERESERFKLAARRQPKANRRRRPRRGLALRPAQLRARNGTERNGTSRASLALALASSLSLPRSGRMTGWLAMDERAPLPSYLRNGRLLAALALTVRVAASSSLGGARAGQARRAWAAATQSAREDARELAVRARARAGRRSPWAARTRVPTSRLGARDGRASEEPARVESLLATRDGSERIPKLARRAHRKQLAGQSVVPSASAAERERKRELLVCRRALCCCARSRRRCSSAGAAVERGI